MPRPRSSTFYLPLAPADAPLSLKAKLSVLPPSAANALLAPRSHPASAPAAIASTHTPVPPLDSTNPLAAPPKEDECARLERVLGLCNSSLSSTPGARRTARRHTDAPLPSFHPSSGVNPFSLALTEQPADPRPTSSIQSLPSTSLGISAPAPAASPALGPDGTSTSPRIGASDMDAFASACAFGSADITPVTQASDQTETSTTLSAPATTSTSRPASATAPSRPVTAERRRLSMVPCGLPKIWACRTLYPSKLCSSVSADDDEESTTEQRRTILPHQLVLPPSIASCGSLHPLDARHLLPRHFRMSFPPPPPPCPAAATATAATNPAPESCAPCTDGINTSLTTAGLARTTTISTHSPADETALSPGGESGGDVATCVQMECDGTSDRVMQKALSLQLDESPVRITLTPPGPSSAQPPLASASASTQSTPPPRQRYRLAPLYLHKVLRRSLGATAWARAETVRLARAVEQAYGVALVSQAHVISSSTSTSSSAIGRHTQWEDIVRSGYHLPPVDTTPTSSLVWSGYEDVYIPGEGDQTNTSAGAAFSGQLSAGGANVWIQNVFDSAECAWDIDLEDEDEDDMEMDFDNEDFEAESDTTSSSHFVRESAPEPEERRPVVVLEPTSPHTPVENSHESRSPASNVGVGLGLAVIPKPELEDTRSPSPDGYGGYAAVGKFTWGSEWPSSPTTTIGGARPPTGIARQWSVSDGDKLSSSWRMDEDGPPATPPYHPALSPSTYSSSSSASTSSSGLLAPFSHEEEENIFRYSPLQEEHVGYSHLPEEEEEDDEPVFRYSATHPDDEMEVDLDVPQGPHAPDHYIYEERSLLGAASPCTDTIPISLSPSFPPPPLIGTKISSCGESEDESDLGTTAATAAAAQEEREDEFYDVPSPSAAGVFIIPPSPLTKTSFGQPSPLATTSFGYSSPTVVGPSTPTSTSRFAHQQQQPPLVDDQAPRRSLERIRSSRRSMERIGPAKRSMEWIKPTGRNEYASSSSAHEPSSPTLVAPRPRRASRALENVFSRQSPVFKTSALPNSPPTSSTLLLSPPSSALLLPTSPPSSSLHLPTSPPPLSASSPPLSPLMKAGVAAWTFGSLKSALSNSVSQLVELARSRSPSPLPWLIRGGSGIAASSANAHATTTTLTLAGAATVLASASSNQATPSATPLARHVEEAHESSSTLHTREPSSEELEAERASCVTPTPTSSRPRRASSTTITKVDAVAAVVSVPQVQLETTAGEVVVGTSPPPKRTLSTSSLSSLESEPESESGSSGGVFSRSPSPEPDSRTWDASSLTPRSRPISADAKGAVSNSGRLSPMMIPGSWDPNELLWDDEDVANDQLRI